MATDLFEFGIDFEDNKLKINTGTNPLFIPFSDYEMDMNDIIKRYEKVYIMCLKNSSERLNGKINAIFNKDLSIERLYTLCGYFKCIEFPVSILDNYYFRKIACIQHSGMFNIFGIHSPNDSEIIIPLISSKGDSKIIKHFSKIMTTDTGILDIYDLMCFIKLWYNADEYVTKKIMNKVTNFVYDIYEATYWCNINHCEVEFSSIFNMRNKNVANNDLFIGDESKDSFFSYNSDPIVTSGYLNDVGTNLILNKKHVYYYDNLRDYSSEDVIFNSGINMFDIFNMYLVSKKYCHSVLNSKVVLQKMLPTIKKFMPLYKYLFGYAWNCFYIEEKIKKSNIYYWNRFVFNIDVACLLPSFPFDPDHMRDNPYLSIFLPDDVIDVKNNLMGYKMIKDHDYHLCNLQKFRHRLNLFACGKLDSNIFNFLNNQIDYAICGSVIPACSQKYPILIDWSDQTKSYDEKILEYYDKYYHDSDIDVLCRYRNFIFFVELSNKFCESIKQRIHSEYTVVGEKGVSIYMTRKFLENNLAQINNECGKNWDINKLIENYNSIDVLKYLYVIYLKEKLQKFKQLIADLKFHKLSDIFVNELFKLPSVSEFTVNYVNNINEKKGKRKFDHDENLNLFDENENVIFRMIDKIKFKVTFDKILLKPIQLFTNYKSEHDFFGTISLFHFSCVRGYYSGDNVYYLPSCISALLTGINIDLINYSKDEKFFSLIKKYYNRGFGFILNKDELSRGHFDKVGFRELNFKNIEYVNCSDVKRYGKGCYYNPDEMGINMDMITCINKNGNINPYKKWLPRAYYDSHNSLIAIYMKNKKKVNKIKKTKKN